MFGEQGPGFLDGVHDAPGKMRITKVPGHLSGKYPPKLIATAGVNCLVADDGEFVGAGCHEDGTAFRSRVFSMPIWTKRRCAAATGS